MAWSQRAPVTILSTELASLADGNRILTTSAHDNTTQLDEVADFDFRGTFGTAVSTGALMHLYIVRSVASTASFTYEEGSTADAINPQARVGSFRFLGSTAQQVQIIRGVEIPPGQFHIAVENDAGQSLTNSTTHLLRMKKYTRT